MKFIYSQEPLIYRELAAEPLFSELIQYLAVHKDTPIIHRQLKARFPQKKLEYVLDQSVKAELIERKERRYKLKIPFLHANKPLSQNRTFLNEIGDKIKSVDRVEQIQVLENLWDNWFDGENYFYAAAEDVSFFTKKAVVNHAFQLVHVSLEGCWEENLADYFSILEHGLAMPVNLKPLERLLGDVDREYAYAQLQMVLHRVYEGKGNKIHPSIFSTSLQQTGVISTDNTVLLIPNVPNEKKDLPESFADFFFS